MATLKWTEDYGQYKKGDTFENNDAGSTQYLVESGKVEIISKETHITVSNPEKEQKENQEKTEKAVISQAKTAAKK